MFADSFGSISQVCSSAIPTTTIMATIKVNFSTLTSAIVAHVLFNVIVGIAVTTVEVVAASKIEPRQLTKPHKLSQVTVLYP